MAPEPGVAWACSWTPSGFALCFVDARDENLYDLGSGCTPPHQGVLRRAPGPGFALSDDARDENWHDLGVWVGPSPSDVSWACSRPPLRIRASF